MQILIVDDHAELLDLVARALVRDDHVVRTAGSLADARRACIEAEPDLIVLDLALPDGRGVDLVRELRQQGSQVPVIMLTAHGEVQRRVEGLDAGADDFLAKPFAMAELRARVRALGRRRGTTHASVVVLGATTLDFGARRATAQGAEIPLTGREWSILELLATRMGRVVSRSDILESIWGEVSDASSGSLDVIMARVRRKVGAAHLRTLRGAGYVLEVDPS